MLENVILLAAAQYFVFYIFNYTKVGSILKTPIKDKYDLLVIKDSWAQNLLYPLFCPLCFAFHFTILLFISSFFVPIINSVVGVFTIWHFTVGSLVSLILDNLIKFLAKDA